MDIFSKIDELYDKRREVELGGGQERIDKQHDKGKQTARERIDYLLDEDTFVEFNPIMQHRTTYFSMDKVQAHDEGVVSGYGKIDGRPVHLLSQDSTIFGSALGEMHAKKLANVMDMAA